MTNKKVEPMSAAYEKEGQRQELTEGQKHIIASIPTRDEFDEALRGIVTIDTATHTAVENGELERLRKALAIIAKQKLPSELDEDVRDDADYETGYECCVREARNAIDAAKGEGK